MVSVAELKAKAHKAKSASVTKFHDTRDRYSSVPTANTSYDPDWRKNAPPAPPPTRSSIESPRTSTSSPPPPRPPPSRAPPPIRRTTRPDLVSSSSVRGHEEARHDTKEESGIDWANLSPADKQVFFSWLDEFFARYFNTPVPSRNINNTIKPVAPAVFSRASAPKNSSPAPPTRGPPPIINARSRPPISSSNSSASTSNDFVMSFPAPTVHGCAALDLAHFFDPSTHWDSPWYLDPESPVPPPLKGNTQLTFVTSWQSYGSANTTFIGVVFADLSVCWVTVQYSSTSDSDPNSLLVKRSARYLSCPRPMDKTALVEAHETYGETIAAYAESFEGSGEYCARGECWDLANEALKYFDGYDYVPKPIPSISRTHGHLIFEGKASGKGSMVGRWRGGDDRVRRGDIVEWRNVKINTVDASPYSRVSLGDPDHTAIIVRDSRPSRPPINEQSLSPAELGSLEVVEQSVGIPPQRKNYDLNAFEQGEMWIYRPVGMQAYLGTLLVAKCPDDVRALTL